MRNSLLASVILHLLPLFFLMEPKTENKKEKIGTGDHSSTEVNIIETSPENSKDSFVDKDKDGVLSAVEQEIKKCKTYFGGIGIQQEYFTNILTKVFKGYPADKAGLKVGDIVESISGEDIRGEVGTSIDLKVTRNGTSIIITVVRGKICYDDI